MANMEVDVSRPRSRAGRYVRQIAAGLLYILIASLVIHVAVKAATVTSNVSADILSGEPVDKDISIRPLHIDLHQGEHSRFVVTNNSDQDQSIDIEVESVAASNCMLHVTPKHIELLKGAYQVVRLFYTSGENEACQTTFTVKISADDDSRQSIEVKCD